MQPMFHYFSLAERKTIGFSPDIDPEKTLLLSGIRTKKGGKRVWCGSPPQQE
jgi:hypothetical protein